MKKKIFGLLMPLALLASCDNYLDVKSEFDVDSDEIFSTTDGFEMAVNGVYRLMAGTSLYSRDLTWGYASVLGQNYKLGISANKYDLIYDHKNFASYPAAIWEKGFNVIANANHILAQAQSKEASFFEEGETHKLVIEGEMYGIRALMHFELMRLFTPAFTTDANKKTVLMPYVETYPCSHPTHIATSELLKKAIKDMEIAREKLASADTITFYDHNIKVDYRFKTLTGPSVYPRLFFYCRGSRMNFMAATALLARMYMWQGDYTKARKYAQEVIDGYRNGKIIYNFEPSANMNNLSNFRPTRPEEIIFAVNRNLEDSRSEFERYVGADYTKANFEMDDQVMNALFEGDETDARYSGLYWKANKYYNSHKYSVYTRMTSADGFNDTNMSSFGALFPVISLPELYFIVAECDIRNGNIANAMEILTLIRQKRGIMEYSLPTEGVTTEEATNYLRREVVRDGLSFGQTFFWFKRRGQNVWNGLNEIEMTEEKWTVPVPDSETI
ncbi:MAG: RagB/SusD family nutrient uptake outer membrane protein [Rikenellaceae bacterium]|nr:RagB/SusD family nutrient uptake outer membrane protein [Rikenellaceae bacterium]